MSAATSLPSPPGGIAGGYNGKPSTNGGGSTEKVFEHIQDLQAKAQQGYQADDPVAKLLSLAVTSLRQAKLLVDTRRPDLAFVDYLRAYEIAVGVIPRHGTVYDLDPQLDRQYKQLQGQLKQMEEQFMSIKSIIMNNNLRNGTRPRGGIVNGENARGSVGSSSQVNGVSHERHESLAVGGGHKIKPSVSPKPDSLHGRAISRPVNGTTVPPPSDALNDRFARLRLQNGGTSAPRPDSRGSISSVQSNPISMPSAVDWNGRNSFDALSKSTTLLGQPQGPRAMQNGGPVLPAKLPLNTELAAAMPKPPSPTYSPARNMQTTGNIAPPRHTARSLASNDVRRSSMASMSSASTRAPNGSRDSGDYFPQGVPEGAVLGSAPREATRQTLRETRVSNERLFDYLERFSVLLIDVRPRADFDDGHIFASSIMCIEPMTLRRGMSADEVQESLVLSPEAEQEMFFNRRDYDLVVYYDGNTQSETFLSRPQTDREAALLYLHEALTEFSQDKPLRERPMLLIGGLDAWIDLVGQQALRSSNTLERMNAVRPLQRRPPVFTAGSSSLRIPKRRVQDFAPLGQDEERAWHERARQESVSIVPQVQPMIEEEGDGANDEASLKQYEAAIQDFNSRFPDAGAIDRHPDFMRSQVPQRPPPIPPAKLPDYPVAPPASQYSQVPQRPAPAAPRMSYTGVSDRSASQSSLPANRSDHLAPYIPAKLRLQNMILPRTGLINFGVTCYMNSTIQALSATTPLTALFMQDDFRRKVQKNWKGSKGVMPELYSNLIRSLWKGDVEAIKPTTFRSFCGRLNAQWISSQQQDAKEFFDFLIDCLHEDLNSHWQKSPLKALTPQQEAARESAPKLFTIAMEWERITHRDRSDILDLFGGQHISRLRCLSCGFTSSTWEYFMSISVEIPSQGQATLQDCLKQYTSEERLEDGWNCPKCKGQREATKRITITRAPQFLVIHFKRFRSTWGGRSAAKVHTLIDFPLHALDLQPFMLPPPTASDQAAVTAQYGPGYARLDASITPPFSYDAYAVIRHHGNTLGSGHYTTAARDMVKGRWRVHDDSRMREVGVEGDGGGERLQTRDAYIVFYQRAGIEGTGGRL
nr:hypothetical protein B0A51_04619 [Rachicladosporium sp. CCFEE 5018]